MFSTFVVFFIVVGFIVVFYLIMRADQKLLKAQAEIDKRKVDWDKYDDDAELEIPAAVTAEFKTRPTVMCAPFAVDSMYLSRSDQVQAEDYHRILASGDEPHVCRRCVVA